MFWTGDIYLGTISTEMEFKATAVDNTVLRMCAGTRESVSRTDSGEFQHHKLWQEEAAKGNEKNGQWDSRKARVRYHGIQENAIVF